jgi:N-acetylneuraminic acid mutarotase
MKMKRFEKTMKLLIPIFLLLIFVSHAESEWRENSPMPGNRTGASIILMDSTFYIIGGKNQSEFLGDVLAYNPRTDQWDTTSVPDMLTPRADASAVIYQDKIYVIGGRNTRGACREVEVFYPDSNQWFEKKTLKGPRSGLTAVVLRDSLLIFGGIDSDGNYSDKVEWYDSEGDKWIKLSPKMSPPRAGMFSFLNNEKLFFTGGFYFSPLSSTAILNSDGNWSEGVQLSVARGDGGTISKGDSILLIGGESLNGATDIIEVYDTSNNQVSDFLMLPAPRAGHCAGIWKDTLYVFGGYSMHSTDLLSSVIAFHPTITSLIHEHLSANVPNDINLLSNYPNPFNNMTNIEFHLAVSDYVDLKIFDVRGQLVDDLISKRLPGGSHVYHWNIESRPHGERATGVYIAVLRTSTIMLTRKLLYVK